MNQKPKEPKKTTEELERDRQLLLRSAEEHERAVLYGQPDENGALGRRSAIDLDIN